MSDFVIGTIAWVALGLHVVVGLVALRSGQSRPLVPLVNLASATGVLAYWAYRWFGYLFRGITWYATDQLIPLYALLVCVLTVLSLSGRYPGVVLNWFVFFINGLVLIAAVLFLSFFRLNRLF
jgi:hypothetical protein